MPGRNEIFGHQPPFLANISPPWESVRGKMAVYPPMVDGGGGGRGGKQPLKDKIETDLRGYDTDNRICMDV